MVRQYEIYWVNLDPTVGSKIKKTRPCVIISPNVSNKLLNTVLVAPITSTLRNYPMRLKKNLKGKIGQIALDQIRCIDQLRLAEKMDTLSKNEIVQLKNLIAEYLVE